MSDMRRSGSFNLSPKKHPNFAVPGTIITPSTRRQSLSIVRTPTNALIEENNDEEERRRRQLERLQLQTRGTASSPAGTPADRRRSTAAVSGLTHQQLSDHYDTCIKLSAENKINIKNAFNLQLIDYMTEILKRKDSNMNNFQVASCTLDASAKIYAYRVDSVHTDTLRMASGLGRTKEDIPADNSGGDQKMKKRAKTKKSMTVVTNTKTIDVPHFDLEFDVDPLFKKTAAQFDEGRCGGGQFLSALQLLDDSCQLILDSEIMITDLLSKEYEPVNSLIVSIPPYPDLSEKMICPSFHEFEFTSWKLSDEHSLSETDINNDNEHVFDINAVPEPIEDDALPEQDGFDDVMDFDEGNQCDDTTAVTNDGVICRTMPAPQLEIVNLKDHLASGSLEYSYFDNKCMSAWAGPGHWKFKPLIKNRLPKIPTERKKTFITLDYTVDDELSRLFVVQKKPTKLTKNTVKNWTSSNTTLPIDLHYDAKNFSKLFLRPSLVVRRLIENSSEMQEVNDSIGEYDYNNVNDQENFCADIHDGSNYGDNDGPSGFFSQTLLPSQEPQMNDETTDFLGNNLVDAPNKIAKINIGYARTAKKIDMKKLKSTIWIMLSDEEINKENRCNEANMTRKSTMSVRKNQPFSELYQNMFPRLPTHMAQSLSVPLAFIALLHLANEHNLQMLSTSTDLGDFTISQN